MRPAAGPFGGGFASALKTAAMLFVAQTALAGAKINHMCRAKHR